MMLHYTLNTGQSVCQSRSVGVGEAILALRPLVLSGGGVIPFCAPFRVMILRADGSALFTIWRPGEPLVTCVLAWTADGEAEAWRTVEDLYREIRDEHPDLITPGRGAEKPVRLPWLAVVRLPHLVTQRTKDIAWLDDFERCLAWTILESR